MDEPWASASQAANPQSPFLVLKRSVSNMSVPTMMTLTPGKRLIGLFKRDRNLTSLDVRSPDYLRIGVSMPSQSSSQYTMDLGHTFIPDTPAPRPPRQMRKLTSFLRKPVSSPARLVQSPRPSMEPRRLFQSLRKIIHKTKSLSFKSADTLHKHRTADAIDTSSIDCDMQTLYSHQEAAPPPVSPSKESTLSYTTGDEFLGALLYMIEHSPNHQSPRQAITTPTSPARCRHLMVSVPSPTVLQGESRGTYV